MKKTLLPFTLLLILLEIQAQTQNPFIFRPIIDGASGMTILQQNSPDSGWAFSANNDGLLRIFRTDNPSSILSIHYKTGNVGIGTVNTNSKLVISDTGEKNVLTLGAENGIGCLGFNRNVKDGYIFNKTISAWQFTARDERFALEGYNGAPNNLFCVLKNGNMGIGTNNPVNKLDVNGTIRATEVKVETGWADFVFDKDYNLPSLSEVENHINAQNRLPDIPSEAEVRENGVSLGEMQVKLLQKIEELTLYTIQQQKQLDKQNKEIQELKNQSNKK